VRRHDSDRDRGRRGLDGRVAGLIGVIVDMTDARGAERQLLDFAAVKQGVTTRLQAADAVESVLRLLQSALRRDGIEVVVHLPAGLPPLRCRAQQVQQLLLNLILNARDALVEAPEGRGRPRRIEVTGAAVERQGRSFIRLTVRDEGPGIPAAILERLIEPFFTTRDRTAHTGMGLAVCRAIVANHGGNLYIESEPGKETRVCAELPAAGFEETICESQDGNMTFAPLVQGLG